MIVSAYEVQKTILMEKTLWCKNVKMITHLQYFHMVLNFFVYSDFLSSKL